MNRRVIIIGYGGHGRVVADIVAACGDLLVGFLDDDITKKVLGTVAEFDKFSDVEFIIGIGNAEVREKLSAFPVRWYTAVHPSAVISPSVEIGEGTVVMPNVVINSGAVIGKHCIINSSSNVEHNCSIADYSHISVGAKIGGAVSVGKSTWVGIGAVISNNLSVCDNCLLGAGTVVVKNITQSGTYVGVPARKILR